VDERLAHQSNGVFILRIEDTDDKRKVEGAVETIISSWSSSTSNLTKEQASTEKQAITAVFQSNRAEIYQTVAKHLVENGQSLSLFLLGRRT